MYVRISARLCGRWCRPVAWDGCARWDLWPVLKSEDQVVGG